MKFSEIKEKLEGKKVGIAGAGGLGSNCAAALVRSGVQKLVIADFDKVDESNLNRQFYFQDQIGQFKVDALKENLLKINPELSLIIRNYKLDQDKVRRLFRTCDVIVEAFDLSDQKKMLIETIMEYYPEKPVVVGSGMAGWGKSNDISVKKDGNIYICGDEKSEISDELPPLAPRVGIVANMQANTVLEILLG